MKLHCVNANHRFTGTYNNDPAELDEYDMKRLKEAGVVEAWYWYGQGSYSGAGHMIACNKDGKWAHIDMGHCSCNGPLEDLSTNSFVHATSQAIFDAATSQLREELKAIMEAIA